MLTYLFPGQGSQFQGMGEDLFIQFPELTQQADDYLGYSIAELCKTDTQQKLHLTQYTQPALYTVSALSYLKIEAESTTLPDYVAGHSLGEYNALFAAGVFDFITGLKLVSKRGELMSQAQNGGMAAVVGIKRPQLEKILAEYQLTELTIANDNAPEQKVLSGLQVDINRAQEIFSRLNITFIPLKVSGAFHSSFMAPAQQEFSQFLDSFSFNKPKIPVLANVNAKPYNPMAIKNNLVQQITQTVEWTTTIEYLLAKPNMAFKEIGPGSVLTGLLKKIQAHAENITA
ncbi:MAG: [acyl-carrier-protein] S-malonyltransferase [Legionella sp. 40-6]|nr:ACP S-malonyltransferase [Legionella sp.]OJY38799.1 MAG: [acyl-carrier-protein] S-malonyltransferase [Legionella sp. 40-6]